MKIAVLSPSAQSLQETSAKLDQGKPERVITRHEGGIGMLRSVADHESVDVFIIDTLSLDTADLSAVEYVTSKYPHIFIIMLCPEQSSELLIRAMRVGVRELLPSPVKQDALEAAVLRAESKLALRNAKNLAQVIAFVSCKGGSGATFLAANTGYQLGEQGKKVLLIDLNLQFGEALLLLHDRKASSDIVQIAQNLSRLDASFLASSVVAITPNFSILPAPEDPVQQQDVKPEQFEAILNLAATQYDFVILDVRKYLDDLTIKALDRANKIVLVVQTLLPYVRNATRLMNIFRALGYPPEKVEVLVNRFWKGDEIGLDQLRASMGVSALHTVPNGYKEIAKAINLGVPLASVSKSCSVYMGIEQLVESLQLKKVTETPTGLLSRLLNR
jgi:pilus assembly protein CpaE